jgi:hypothetical protein
MMHHLDTASKMANKPAATKISPTHHKTSPPTITPAIRQIPPITPRAIRPWRSRLGRKKPRIISGLPVGLISFSLAKRQPKFYNGVYYHSMNFSGWSESYLWASLIWSSIASGYLIYGWKQRSLFPFLGGLAMTAVSFLLSPLPMSLACIAIIFGVWWLMRQRY